MVAKPVWKNVRQWNGVSNMPEYRTEDDKLLLQLHSQGRSYEPEIYVVLCEQANEKTNGDPKVRV